MSATQDNKAATALLEQILRFGREATKPDADEVTKQAVAVEFQAFLKSHDTYTLMDVLTYLIQPGRVPDILRKLFMNALTLLPLRPDGVRATTEFVFSKHPSSTVSSSEALTPQTNGANITQEALNMAVNVLTNPPRDVPPEEWYPAIARQLVVLLDGQDGYDSMKVASYAIGFGILGRRPSGAPGKSGPHDSTVTQWLIQGRQRRLESRHGAHPGSYKPFI